LSDPVPTNAASKKSRFGFFDGNLTVGEFGGELRIFLFPLFLPLRGFFLKKNSFSPFLQPTY
jgi:hypothetical protein